MSDSIGYCTIDENGMVLDQNKHPILALDQVHTFFDTLQLGDNFELTAQFHNQTVFVEVFDSPLIAKEIKLSPQSNELINSYGLRWEFELSSLVIDEWDRFHGLTTTNLPFTMNRKAQDQFFDQLDEFDDDTFCYNKVKYTPGPFWIVGEPSINTEFYWTQKYIQDQAGWDLGEPAAGLKYLLPKLKLPASRVLVIGGGNGHDAAHFAQQGHHVTQIDISPEAITRAKNNYGNLNHLKFIEADIFELPHTMYNQYDVVFEHTCFCAIDPNRRNDLIKQWRRLLHSEGTLLGVFFTMPKRVGPPFGASEWELRRRLQSHFQPLIWERFRHSIKPRLGRELLTYLKKK